MKKAPVRGQRAVTYQGAEVNTSGCNPTLLEPAPYQSGAGYVAHAVAQAQELRASREHPLDRDKGYS